ncbi:tellurite resistance TerB C-terminal domain-containing protein, partial [Croceicoccus hydrothermalis]|uniref:tellurite resistance TerB C-terminal domain-containing protein n=1 Tax=Croceicoccus hydrothermalis TaxID=2867964 RepID=UPI001EFAD051
QLHHQNEGSHLDADHPANGVPFARRSTDEIASKQGLMPSGALEVVNEWAFDKFDEALLDEYDGYDVSPDIADTLRAEMAKGD